MKRLAVELSRKEWIELNFYRFLGVKLFQKLVFLVEKIVRYRRGGKNINYHIGGFSGISIDSFKKYLFYNGSIHVRNLFYMTIYFFFRCVLGRHFFWPDIIALMLVIKDLYCIMLQRYNYIRICSVLRKKDALRKSRIEHKAEKVRVTFEGLYDPSYKENDLDQLRKLRAIIENNGIASFDQKMMETITRMNSATSHNVKENPE